MFESLTDSTSSWLVLNNKTVFLVGFSYLKGCFPTSAELFYHLKCSCYTNVLVRLEVMGSHPDGDGLTCLRVLMGDCNVEKLLHTSRSDF